MPIDPSPSELVPVESVQNYSLRLDGNEGSLSKRPNSDPGNSNARPPGMMRRGFLRCLVLAALGGVLYRSQSSSALPPSAANPAQSAADNQNEISSLPVGTKHACIIDRADDHDRNLTLPYNLEAEIAMLGCMLISPTGVISEFVEAGVSEAWFYRPAHATIYSTLVEFWSARNPCDIITLTQILRDRKLLNKVGGPVFIVHIVTSMPTAANASCYQEIVGEKYALRQTSGWMPETDPTRINRLQAELRK